MLCNTAYNTKGGLTRHTLKEHKGHKIFMCDTCGKKFQTDKTLSAHVKVVHEQQKPFGCTECEYKAGQKASLIGESCEKFVRKRTLVKYQSQIEVIKHTVD